MASFHPHEDVKNEIQELMQQREDINQRINNFKRPHDAVKPTKTLNPRACKAKALNKETNE